MKDQAFRVLQQKIAELEAENEMLKAATTPSRLNWLPFTRAYKLGKLEARLMALLMAAAPNEVPWEQLILLIEGRGRGDPRRYLYSTLFRVRKKIRPARIETVYFVGLTIDEKSKRIISEKLSAQAGEPYFRGRLSQ